MKITVTLTVEVADVWIEDGFKLDKMAVIDATLQGLGEALPFADDHELKVS